MTCHDKGLPLSPSDWTTFLTITRPRGISCTIVTDVASLAIQEQLPSITLAMTRHAFRTWIWFVNSRVSNVICHRPMEGFV